MKTKEWRCVLMKKMLLALLFLLLFPLPDGMAEVPAFQQFLSAHYEDWAVLDQSVCAPSAAAVMEKEKQKALLVAHLKDGQWQAAVLNSSIVSDDRFTYRVLMDTDADLFLSCLPSSENTLSLSLTFHREKDTWHFAALDSSYLSYAGQAPVPVYLENHIFLSASEQLLRRSWELRDENDNPLIGRSLPPVSSVFTPEETDLAHLDLLELPFDANGYGSDDDGRVREIYLQRLFQAKIASQDAYASYTYQSGLLTDETMQFIAQSPEGELILLCGRYTEKGGWVFYGSSPLPQGAIFGYENFGDYVVLPDRDMGVRVGPYPSGKWGITGVISGDFWEAGPGWIANYSESSADFDPLWGDHPWDDIASLRWESLPKTFGEAIALSDPAAWATPQNPNPDHRLHLRESPSQTARSLGKFWNGAPVRVLKKGKEWSKVRVGSQEGYMMSKYLSFGQSIRKISPHLSRKNAVEPVTSIVWHGIFQPDRLAPWEIGEGSPLVVIGLTGDNRQYILWDPLLDRTGTVPVNALTVGSDG